MATCDAPGCIGHLGKYSSCRDEALDFLALDGMADEFTGSTEWDVHVWRLDLDKPETVKMPGPEAAKVTIPAGFYLIFADSRGFVWAESFDSKDAADARWSKIEDDYSKWLESEGAE